MLLQWMMDNRLVPDLGGPDTWAISRCCRGTWGFFEDHRWWHLGIRAGWVVGDDIFHNTIVYCVHNDIEVRLEAEWRDDIKDIIYRRQPAICQEIRRTVPLETRCESGMDA